ncbi:MAG: Maf-like protein [Alphaproteobacteria bacterium]|nr:MAG: Maf-like protein [Alphaproteobacteria bacterium]
MACLSFLTRKSMSIILASQSSVRRAMLEERAVPFTAITSPYDEDAQKEVIAHLPPVQQSILLAHGKAHAVSILHPEAYVIGADQVCDYNSTIFGKPLVVERAMQHLTALQGNRHYQHSAACIFKGGVHLWSAIETVILDMRSLCDKEIIDYIQTDEPFHACGSYCYEKTGHLLFHSVQGSADAIKGLPLDALYAALTSLGAV